MQPFKDPSYMGHRSFSCSVSGHGFCAGLQGSDLIGSVGNFPVGFEEMGSQKRLH